MSIESQQWCVRYANVTLDLIPLAVCDPALT